MQAEIVCTKCGNHPKSFELFHTTRRGGQRLKEWKVNLLRTSLKLNGIFAILQNQLMQKWVLLLRSPLCCDHVLFQSYSPSFLLRLCFQILRDRNRKYEVPSLLRQLLIIELCWFASIVRDVLHRFPKINFKKFLDPKTFQALDNLRIDREIRQVLFHCFLFYA